MNQDKIGKFISNERKKKNLTQKELAEKLLISEKTISKWECGKGLPEVSLMKPLCKELDITVTELLNGCRDQKSKELKEDGLISYLKYISKKSKYQKIVIVLILIFIILSVLFFLNSYSKITIYELNGQGSKFSYNGGTLIKSNIYNIYNFGEIRTKTGEVEKEQIRMILLKCDNQIIVGSSDPSNLNMNVTEKYGYNAGFDNYKLKNIDKWYLEIIYEEENIYKKDIVPITNNIIMKNDKFISLPTIPIGFGESSRSKEREKQTFENVDQEIINLGFQVEYKDIDAEYLTTYSKVSNKEKVYITNWKFDHKLTYKYELNDNSILTFNYDYFWTDNEEDTFPEEISGVLEKDGLNYNFNYNPNTKEMIFTYVVGNDNKYIETSNYPEIDNINNICQSFINYKRTIYEIFDKYYNHWK